MFHSLSQSLSYVFCNFNMLFSFFFNILPFVLALVCYFYWYVIVSSRVSLKCCLCFSCCVKTKCVSSVWAFVLAVLWATVKQQRRIVKTSYCWTITVFFCHILLLVNLIRLFFILTVYFSTKFKLVLFSCLTFSSYRKILFNVITLWCCNIEIFLWCFFCVPNAE